jgi:sulfur carrier protein
MKLIINGKRHIHKGAANLPALLKELKIDGNRVAIMVNDNVIAGKERARFPLQEGDRIELLTFAGGG